MFSPSFECDWLLVVPPELRWFVNEAVTSHLSFFLFKMSWGNVTMAMLELEAFKPSMFRKGVS